jgi:hypothetical protein
MVEMSRPQWSTQVSSDWARAVEVEGRGTGRAGAGVNEGVVSSLKTGVGNEGRDNPTANARVPLFLFQWGLPEDRMAS